MRFLKKKPAEQLVDMMLRIYRNGMTTTSGGNLSIKDDEGNIWITPGGTDKGSMTPEDIVCMKPDGTMVGNHRPSVELPFHSSIYRIRPDIKAIVHAHPPALVAFSTVRRIPDVRLTEASYSLCSQIAMAPYAIPGSQVLGDYICEEFKKGANLVMLENHGVVAGGCDMWEAFTRFETLDFTARMQMDSLRFGTPTTLPSARMEELSGCCCCCCGCGSEFTLVAHTATAEEQSLRNELAAFTRRSYSQRLFTSYWGGFSARLGKDAFLLAPDVADPMDIQPEDFVFVSGNEAEEGKTVCDCAQLHLAVYRAHPEINAIANAQPASLMAFALTDTRLDTCTIPESFINLRDVPRLPYSAAHENVGQLTKTLGAATPAVLVGNEGIVVVGGTLLQAFDRLEVADYTARALVGCTGLGNVVNIVGKDVDDIVEFFNLPK